jgi:hypothetical protein
MVNRLLPHSVQDARMLAFESAIDRLMSLDLSVLRVYDIDNVPATALYDLADQFNVLGNRGWNLADTEQEKRELIKQAITLHKTAGTPYSIKLALAAVGYPNSTIIENPGLRYDGSATYDGTERYRGDVNGYFIVVLSGALPAPNRDQVRLILALIEEWKNLRSLLFDLRQNDRSLLANPLYYDGRVSYDGTQTYDGTIEEI